ncbi:hypothetical protein ACHAWF_017225 [Thalassiosira exigua]
MWKDIVVVVIGILVLANARPETEAATSAANATSFDDGDPAILKGRQSRDASMRLRYHVVKNMKRSRGYGRRKKKKKKRSKVGKASRRPDYLATESRPGRKTSCFSVDDYDAIDKDINNIQKSIRDIKERSHFLGGTLRLAAHDHMDFDPRKSPAMGADGCFDVHHPNNAGLETMWCKECSLRELYRRNYSHMSRADFWISAANAVIRIASDGELDLKSDFVWGRRDRDSCRGSGDRLPKPSGCDGVEDVYLKRMGLSWRDIAALLGGHTLGRGNIKYSGHQGTWVEEDQTVVFDNRYYKEIFDKTWRPRNMYNKGKQDWTTGSGYNRMMLNTDMCLVFDVDAHVKQKVPCCTKLDGGCVEREAAKRQCPMIGRNHYRFEAAQAVRDLRDDNDEFYESFAKAWRKVTTIGQDNLSRLEESC